MPSSSVKAHWSGGGPDWECSRRKYLQLTKNKLPATRNPKARKNGHREMPGAGGTCSMPVISRSSPVSWTKFGDCSCPLEVETSKEKPQTRNNKLNTNTKTRK